MRSIIKNILRRIISVYSPLLAIVAGSGVMLCAAIMLQHTPLTICGAALFLFGGIDMLAEDILSVKNNEESQK